MRNEILQSIIRQFKDKKDKSLTETEYSFTYTVGIDAEIEIEGDKFYLFGCLDISGHKETIHHEVELSEIKFNLDPLLVFDIKDKSETPIEFDVNDIMEELEKELIPYL